MDIVVQKLERHDILVSPYSYILVRTRTDTIHTEIASPLHLGHARFIPPTRRILHLINQLNNIDFGFRRRSSDDTNVRTVRRTGRVY